MAWTSEAVARVYRPKAMMVARTDTLGGAARCRAWQCGHHIMAGRICRVWRIVWRVVWSRSRRRSKVSMDIAASPACRTIAISSGNQTFWASPEAIRLLCRPVASWTRRVPTRATAAVCPGWGAYEARSETWTAPLIDKGGGRVAGKPAAKVRERHGHGVGNDRLPRGPVRPAAHGPPGHHPRPGVIDKEPPVVRPRIERARGFDGRDHKAIQRATLGHRAAPSVVRHGSRVRKRPLPAGASRGSIPQTQPPAQGAARAAADPDSAQKTGKYRAPKLDNVSADVGHP